MENDKAFALYAFALVGAVIGMFGLSVTVGIASLPTLGFLVEHAALALVIRASYKSFGGSDPVVEFLEYYGWKTASEATLPEGALPSAA